jgi:hypothetical protein
MAFHVFVEGASDESPGALERLAQAIAEHYGLGASDLLARLRGGRFRVKGNTDRATAETYARDLQRLGARVTIDESAGPMATPPAGTPVVAKPQTTKPPPMSSGLAAAGTAANAPPSNPAQVASGLSAAYSGNVPAADLGALASDANISLSSLDGVDDNSGGVDTAGGAISASIGPAPEKPKPKGKAKAQDAAGSSEAPLDLFAPPEAQQSFSVDIADDDRHLISKPAAAERTSQPAIPVPTVVAAPASPPVTTVPSKLGPLADERVRLAAGVIAAVLIGFVPAHFIAKMKEDSSDRAIDQRVIVAQQAAETPEMYADLDRMRADQLSRKKDEHRNAALIGFAIWALCGGGIAYAWFRKVPWDSLS